MSKILVIDDDADLRDTLAVILEDAGHEVLVADDGACGIAAYRAQHPDLVITDIFMPNSDGFEAIKAIRGISPNAKIIAMSGGTRSGHDFYIWAITKMGAAEVLKKPFEIDDLMLRVNRCLNPDAA